MKIERFKKLTLWILIAVIILNPILAIANPLRVKADTVSSQDEGSDDAVSALINIPNQSAYQYTPQKYSGTSTFTSPISNPAYQSLVATIATYSANKDNLLTFDDLFSSTNQPRISMDQNDLSVLKSMYCLNNIEPDFEHNFGALYSNLPAAQKNEVDTAVKNNPTYKTAADYLAFLKNGNATLSAADLINNTQKFEGYINAAKKNITTDQLKALWVTEENNLLNGQAPSVDINTLVCVTGIDQNRIIEYLSQDRQSLVAAIKTSIASQDIDVRVLKTLVYLITPTNQGGAGHWKIQVQRILQNNSQSNETDSFIQSASASNKTIASCTTDMTAADCGKTQGTTPDLTATDKDGTQYSAYLQSLTSAEDSTLQQRGLSAHASGQAVDISEIDDIRCTEVKVTRNNLTGSTSTSKTKQPIRPIQLSWQTTEGYNATGGSTNTSDLNSLFNSYATQAVQQLLANLGTDVSDYSGDLSKTSFDGIIKVLGQSLLGNVLDSKDLNLSGIDISDTLQKLGNTYVASYLGLPNNIFDGEDINSIDDIKYVIGRTAIEKKLGIPYGSLDGDNLKDILTSVGENKLEQQMDLNSGDLAGFENNKANVFPDYVGRKVIEKELSLPEGSWPTDNVKFSDLSKNLNAIQIGIIRNQPGFVDSDLNLGAGTMTSFINGTINSGDFANLVGQKRISDTLYGLKYFSTNNSAFQLPGPTPQNPSVPDTWGLALQGNKDSLTTIGVYTMARLLASTSTSLSIDPKLSFDKIRVTEDGYTHDIDRGDFGQFVIRQWLETNMTKTGDECSAPAMSQNANFTIDSSGQIIIKSRSTIASSLPTPPLTQTVQYSLVSGTTITPQPAQKIVIPEDAAISAGFGKLDIQRVFGCATGSGKAVFQRIGSTLLYTGVINNLLSPEDKTKNDILNTNPTLKINDNSVLFYTTRVNTLKTLLTNMQKNWNVFVKNNPDYNKTTKTIDDLNSSIGNMFNDTDSDTTKVTKTWSSLASISSKLDSAQTDITTIKKIANSKSTSTLGLNELNQVALDANEMVRVSSEIIQGQTIPTSDSIKFSLISASSIFGTGSDNSNVSASINPVTAASLIFGFLAGKISAKELCLRIGASQAESKLGLPQNSLIYFVKKFEQKGKTDSDSFYQAIGEAKVEQTYNMPPGYFYNNSDGLDAMPSFNNTPWAVLKYADRNAVNTSVNRFLTIYPSGDTYAYSHTSDLLGGLPTSLSGAKSDDELTTILSSMMLLDNYEYKTLVVSATNNWKAARAAKIAAAIAQQKSDNLDAVIKNIKAQNLNDPMNSAESDFLMKLGFGSASYTALKSGGVLAWNGANTTATNVDNKLGIATGSTKALITQDKTYYSNVALSNSDKQLMESNLKVSKDAMDLYLQMLNHKIAPSDLSQYNSAVNSPDYVDSNPYSTAAVTGSSCPVTFEKKGGFNVNENTLEANTFCYYDKDGRHCFQSPEEAESYSAAHTNRRYGNIIEEIAAQISTALSGKISANELTKSITNFVEDPTAQYAFANNKDQNNTFLNAIADSTGIKMATLQKLFSRDDTISITISKYSTSVGRAAAQNILTSKIFSSLGLKIDPATFSPDDVFNILNGDMTPLYRLATSYIDKALNLKTGTVLALYNAGSQSLKDCTLDQIGGQMLGSLVGLDYFPLEGNNSISDFLGNFGQSKIEQVWNLPRGTFYGSTLSEALGRAGALNVAVALKLPLTNTDGSSIITDTELSEILGAGYAAKMKGSTSDYKAQQLENFIKISPALTSAGIADVEKINHDITTQFANAVTQLSTSATISGDLKTFYQTLNFYDQSFSLPSNTTYDLLKEQNSVTPDSYNQSVGTKLGTTMVEGDIAQGLGLDKTQSAAAVNLINTVNNIFKCQGNLVTVKGKQVCVTNGKVDSQYHNWGNLYGNLRQIFSLKLDQTANLPDGTIQKIIDDPSNAGVVLFGIAAGKLDQQFGLNSSSIESFTGLFTKVSTEMGVNNKSDSCMTQAASDPSVAPLALNLHNAKSQIDLVNSQKPAQKSGQSDADYQNSTEYETWLSNLQNALGAEQTAELALSDSINQKYSICKIGNEADPTGATQKVGQTFTNSVIDWAKDVVAQNIHDYIYNITAQDQNGNNVRVGVNMPKDDITALMHGDMRYFETASLAVMANYAMIPIDGIRTNNCGGSQGSTCRSTVPSEMQITYDDIKASILGTTSDIYQRAAWSDVSAELTNRSINNTANTETDNLFGGTYSNPIVQYACVGDGCSSTGSPTGQDNVGALLADMGNNNQSLSGDTLINKSLDQDTGYSTTNYQNTLAGLQKLKTDTETTCTLTTLGAAPSSDVYKKCLSDNYATTGDPNDEIARLQNPKDYYSPNGTHFAQENNDTVNSMKNIIQKAAVNNLEYKMMDIALWKLDDNVFPGMSKALMSGNAEMKTAAIAKYLQSGLQHGHLFGTRFKAVQNIQEWAQIALFTDQLLTNNPNAFTNFAGTSGFSFLSNYISQNSNNWLGFDLSSDMVKGLLVGTFTGDWGVKTISVDSIVTNGKDTHTITSGGKQISLPTVGGVITTTVVSNMFKWADKQLGLPVGQSFQVFKLGYTAYKSWKVYNELVHAKDLSNLTSFSKDTQAFINASKGKLTNVADARTAAKNAYKASVQAGVMFVVTILVDKYLGKQISQVEQNLGMIPGTLNQLIVTLSYDAVVVVADAAFDANLTWVNPWIAVGIAVLGWALGSTTKIYYYCDADGYFPEVDTRSNASVTGMGVWGGEITSSNQNSMNTLIQNKTIEAAQNKARGLIGDMLSAQNYSQYNSSSGEPLEPIQIMTARQADVDYYDGIGLITSNMCQARLGKGSISCGGICGSNDSNGCKGTTKMGIFANPQTVAWTHIGF